MEPELPLNDSEQLTLGGVDAVTTTWEPRATLDGAEVISTRLMPGCGVRAGVPRRGVGDDVGAMTRSGVDVGSAGGGGGGVGSRVAVVSLVAVGVGLAGDGVGVDLGVEVASGVLAATGIKVPSLTLAVESSAHPAARAAPRQQSAKTSFDTSGQYLCSTCTKSNRRKVGGYCL